MQQGGAQAAAAQERPRGMSWSSIITQLLIFWMISNLFFHKNDTTEDPYVKTTTENELTPNIENTEVKITTTANTNVNSKEAGKIPCLFHSEQELSLQIFLTESQNFPLSNEPLYEKYPFTLRSATKYQLDFNITTTEYMQNNGSMYLHIVLAEKAFFETFPSPNKNLAFLHIVNPMNVFKLQDKFVQRQNLITGELNMPDLTKENLHEERKIISFWKPSITISVVDVFYHLKPNAIPEQIRKHVTIHPSGKSYYPIIYLNEFWSLDEHLIAVNETVDVLPFTIYFDPLSLTWFSIYQQFDDSFRMQESLGSTKREIDEVKLMILDTNPYFLALTVAVTLLHTVFDFLAFKNDITFWKNKKDMKGLSIKSIFWSVFSQMIIFLYLLDNDTSFLILLSSGIGIFIEAWKITKAVNVSVEYRGAIPILKFQDKDSYVSETKEYDDIAFKWLGRLLFPLVIGYSIYSLYYDTHKSWYSWVLASLTGCVYTFGFIMMTPQLFINYKLKSVAHLPWRTFTYKALNTFIDDMFAFIIRMPTLHRLSCFRDDIIFFIFLYQRYIYPVDKKRVNEFGGTGEDVQEPVNEQNDNKPKKE